MGRCVYIINSEDYRAQRLALRWLRIIFLILYEVVVAEQWLTAIIMR